MSVLHEDSRTKITELRGRLEVPEYERPILLGMDGDGSYWDVSPDLLPPCARERVVVGGAGHSDFCRVGKFRITVEFVPEEPE